MRCHCWHLDLALIVILPHVPCLAPVPVLHQGIHQLQGCSARISTCLRLLVHFCLHALDGLQGHALGSLAGVCLGEQALETAV